MNLHLIHTNKFKTTVACLLLRQPLERETATVTAIVPSVLSRGCEKYPTLSKMNRELENMHGGIFEAQVIKKAEEQLIQLYIESVPDDLLRALEFMREVLLHPLTENGGFKTAYVDGERANLKLAIGSRINNKAEYAKLRALEEMCRDERFGIYGDGYIEDVDGLTPEGIYARYREVLSGAVELVIMGDEGTGLERRVREIFPFEHRDTSLPLPTPGYPSREPQTVTEHCDITQGKICMGYRTGAGNTGADVYSLMLMNEVLGGSAGSKLFMNIREKENLCYYVNSFVYRAKAIVFVQSGVDQKNFDRLEELVNRQIKEIADDGVSDTELEGAKKSLVKKLRGIQDSQAASIDFYMSQHMLNDQTELKDVLSRIERLERGDVCEMAGRMRLDTVFRLTV